MRKVMLMVIAIMLVSTMAFAAGEGSVQVVFNNAAVSTDTTVVVTSDPIPVKSAGYFGVWYKFSNSSQSVSAIASPEARITYEMSYDDNPLHFVTPTGASDVIASETTLATKVTTVSPTPMKYIRFKCYPSAAFGTLHTSTLGNTTGTTITLYLFKQE